MSNFLDAIQEFTRVMFKPRLAGLLYTHYRLYWRGIVFASARTHKIIYANPFFLQKTGFSEKDLRKKAFIDFVHPKDKDKTLAEMKKLGEGGTTVTFANRYQRPDSSYIKVTWTAAIIDGWYICEAEPNG